MCDWYCLLFIHIVITLYLVITARIVLSYCFHVSIQTKSQRFCMYLKLSWNNTKVLRRFRLFLNSNDSDFQVLTLIQKTNADWWSARRANGQEGYVPANYCKEIEPKVIQKSVKHPVKQPVKVKVLKKGVRQELVKKPKSGTSLRRTPSGNYSWVSFPVNVSFTLEICVL